MSRLWKFRLIASGIPTLVGLIAIGIFLYSRGQLVVNNDGAVRIQSPPIYVQEPGHERTGHKCLYDSELGWVNIPDWTATTFGQTLSTNSKNLRDREYSYEKPAGWRRILVLGDSFTWGYGVGNSDIFTEIMETAFECDEMKWQVINTGVSGWGTDQEYLYFVREGANYSPDIVVLAFYLGNALVLERHLVSAFAARHDALLQRFPFPRNTTRPSLNIFWRLHRRGGETPPEMAFTGGNVDTDKNNVEVTLWEWHHARDRLILVGQRHFCRSTCPQVVQFTWN